MSSAPAAAAAKPAADTASLHGEMAKLQITAPRPILRDAYIGQASDGKIVTALKPKVQPRRFRQTTKGAFRACQVTLSMGSATDDEGKPIPILNAFTDEELRQVWVKHCAFLEEGIRTGEFGDSVRCTLENARATVDNLHEIVTNLIKNGDLELVRT
jgi:hypothetical protein